MKSRYLGKYVLALASLAALLITGCTKDKPASGDEHAGHTGGAMHAPAKTLAVTVDAQGFHPGSLTAGAGEHVRLTFKRTSDEGCGQQIIFPATNVRRDLPLNQPVDVDVMMPASGSLAFQCGMGMLKGSIVVQ